ncbi:MAG: hypothetical protein AAF213_01340 [Pseudomonadota bacterium]
MAKQGFISSKIEMGLDVLGTADPTGIVDAGHAISLAARGRWTDAALTGAGVIPYIGDTAKLAKYAKYAKNAKKIGNLPGVSDLKDGLDGAIDQGVHKMAKGGLHGPMSSASPMGMLKPGGVGAWRALRQANQMLHDTGHTVHQTAGMDQRENTRRFAPR